MRFLIIKLTHQSTNSFSTLQIQPCSKKISFFENLIFAESMKQAGCSLSGIVNTWPVKSHARDRNK